MKALLPNGNEGFINLNRQLERMIVRSSSKEDFGGCNTAGVVLQDLVLLYSPT